MSSISTAIGAERVSRISGYKINKGVFSNPLVNLLQQVVVLAEANVANQSTISTDKVQITSADQAGNLFGFGSPMHQIMRILHPVSGDGIGGIPVYAMAQLAANGATQTVLTWQINGTATASITHNIRIAGRETLDAKRYSLSITKGDKGDAIATKYAAAINSILSSPVIANTSSSFGTFEIAAVAMPAGSLNAGVKIGFAGLSFTAVGTRETALVTFNATSLAAGETVTLAGLTFTSTGVTTQAQMANAFANLSVGATTGSSLLGIYSGTLTGYSTGIIQGGNAVTFTSTVVGNVTDLTSSGTGAAPSIAVTQGSTTLTQAQVAAAFANILDGASSGAGASYGTYSGTLSGYSTGNVTSGTTVTFRSSVVGNVTDLVQTGTAAPATITITQGVEPVGVVTLTTKWAGASSNTLQTSIDVNGNAAGITYAVISTTAGTGAADISAAIAQFEDNWYTTVINSYGVSTLDTLEAFNGIPDDNNPTGRWAPTVFKPFMAFFGSTDPSTADLIAITDNQSRVNQVTNVLCPAPKSEGFPWEAAANMVLIFCRTMQDTPELDVCGQYYPDMPVPYSNSIGEMSDYNNRDILVQKGCSTVKLDNGNYQVQDLVTTYHPTNDSQFQYRYSRNLNLDWNVKDGYAILENLYVKDHVIIADIQITDSLKAIKPKEWAAVLFDYFDALATASLINDPGFSKASLQVQIDPTNPNRLNTFFRYKRTGISRIESTDVQAGF